MTNVPASSSPTTGYWPAARISRAVTALCFIADETHTICAGPGGCTRA